MLQEIKNISQTAGEHSRWFQDGYWDLYVWEDGSGQIEGFQLCYDKPQAEKALSWKRGGRTSHTSVQGGDGVTERGSSPLLGAQAEVEASRLLAKFEADSAKLDPAVFETVRAVLAGLGRTARAEPASETSEGTPQQAPAASSHPETPANGTAQAPAAEGRKLRFDPASGQFGLE